MTSQTSGVGICGTWLDAGPGTPIHCTLLAGHAGWHGNGGTSWGKISKRERETVSTEGRADFKDGDRVWVEDEDDTGTITFAGGKAALVLMDTGLTCRAPYTHLSRLIPETHTDVPEDSASAPGAHTKPASTIPQTLGSEQQTSESALAELLKRSQASWPRKTSGVVTERVTSATGGQKDKKLAQLGAIDPKALLALAEVAGAGGQKYEPYNMLKGYDWSLSFNAAQRHLLAFWSLEDFDPESGQAHVLHAAWHCLTLYSFLTRELGIDDRYVQTSPSCVSVEVTPDEEEQVK